MDVLSKLPPDLRNRDSIRAMADSLERTKRTAADLRAEVRAGPNPVRVALPSFLGSYGAGFLDARMPTVAGTKVQTSVAAGIALVAGGYFSGTEMAMWAGIGALNAQAYAMGVKQAGYDLAILEREAPPGTATV